MTSKEKHLYYLNELSDYKVSDKDPDVRGWDVRDSDNRVIGKVDNLLVNKEREQVVYLDVEVDKSIIEANHDPYGTPASEDVHEFINKEGENHIIIPVGLVSLNDDQKFVFTDRINHQTFSGTKRIKKGSNVERHYEINVLDSYDRFGDPEARKREREERLEEDYDEDFRRTEAVNDDSYEEDLLRDKRSADSESTYETRRKKGRIPDDDSFYDRREFDRSNYRKDRR